MKGLIFLFVVTTSLFCFGRGPSPEAIEQGRRNLEIVNTQLGGFIGDKRNAVGAIAVVDAQNVIPAQVVQEQTSRLENGLYMAFTYGRFGGGAVDFANLNDAKKSVKGNVWIILTENPTMPALVSLPEQRTVLINVSALAFDKPDQAKLQTRLTKEMSRAVCFAFVVRYSAKAGGLMDPIESIHELDKVLVDQMGVDCKANIDRSGMLHFGIKRFPRKTYLDACKEGWAPPPKTEAQKKIWNDVHSAPANPMKIEFDPKKGR